MTKGLNVSRSELKQAQNNEHFVKQAAQQVVKDFAISAIQIELPSAMDFAYQFLYDQVLDVISDLYLHNEEKLRSLLYRIDLSEKDLRQVRMANSDQTRAIITTELILEREMQKVILRNYFSKL